MFKIIEYINNERKERKRPLTEEELQEVRDFLGDYFTLSEAHDALDILHERTKTEEEKKMDTMIQYGVTAGIALLGWKIYRTIKKYQ